MCLYHVSQQGGCRGADATEIFAFCDQFRSWKGPSSQKPNVTLSLCLSADSAAGFLLSKRPPRTHPHHLISVPVIAREAVPVQRMPPALGARPGQRVHSRPAAVFSSQPVVVFCTSSNSSRKLHVACAHTLDLLRLFPPTPRSWAWAGGLAEPMRRISFLLWHSVSF